MAKTGVEYHSVPGDEDAYTGSARRASSSNRRAGDRDALGLFLRWKIGRGMMAVSLIVLGFVLGSVGPLRLSEPLLACSSSVRHEGGRKGGFGHPPSTVFDTLSALPKLDLWEEYGLNESKLTLYPKPLGKRICIMDVDTRQWDPTSSGLENQTTNAWGMMNHYLYAKTHGYDYKFVQVPEIEGLSNTWVKVKEMHRLTMMEKYDFVVFTDSDVIFPDLRLPFERLLSHWNITKDIALAGALDPDVVRATDMNGHTNINTGFIITQNVPRFDELMRAWIECPTDARYPQCSIWSHIRHHEQSALSSYVRYDYADIIREISLDDANSADGKFVKHYWYNKKDLKQIVSDTVASRLMPEVFRGLVEEWHSHSENLLESPPPLLEPPVNTSYPADAPTAADGMRVTWPTKEAASATKVPVATRVVPLHLRAEAAITDSPL